jgi:hypothetical protein
MDIILERCTILYGLCDSLIQNLLDRGGKNRRAREHCSQEMLNGCRKFLWMKICYWKFEGNLNTHVPPWVQQHMVYRHYSLNLKPWSARTLYVYVHADLAQKYSVGLQDIFVSSLCSQAENYFFLTCSSINFDVCHFNHCYCMYIVLEPLNSLDVTYFKVSYSINKDR